MDRFVHVLPGRASNAEKLGEVALDEHANRDGGVMDRCTLEGEGNGPCRARLPPPPSLLHRPPLRHGDGVSFFIQSRARPLIVVVVVMENVLDLVTKVRSLGPGLSEVGKSFVETKIKDPLSRAGCLHMHK